MTSTGLGWLEGNIPYIQGWPSSRKPVDMTIAPIQTLSEAAHWCEIATLVGNWQFTSKNLFIQGFQHGPNPTNMAIRVFSFDLSRNDSTQL